MTDFEERFAHFNRMSSTTIAKTNDEVAAINAKVSFHLAHMQERVNTCMSRISQASGRFNSQLSKISADHFQKFNTDTEAAARSSMPETIGRLIQPHMQAYMDKLDQQATELLVNMEETYMDYISQIQ